MSLAKKRVVIDVSNLSIHAKKFIKTGIQEVIYKTLISVVPLRQEFPDLEILLLPQLPRRFGNALTGVTTVPYPSPPRFVLELIEKELDLPSQEVWGIDLRARGYVIPEPELLELYKSADRVHIQGLANVGPLAEVIQCPSLSMTIYDLIPVIYPEYCPDGIPRWYAKDYLPSVGKHVKHAVCISRNTALDLLANPLTATIPKVSVLPLPFELNSHESPHPGLLSKWDLDGTPYLVYLGSLEPRKNFDALLDGFVTFRRQQGERSRLKLVLIGSTGWKNALIEKRIRRSEFSQDIVATGYLTDADLAQVIRSSAGLAMLSQYEGYGLPVAQAYSLGVPVITTYGSSLPEACGSRGIFVEPSDPYSVAGGIAVALGTGPGRGVPDALAGWSWSGYARNLIGAMG